MVARRPELEGLLSMTADEVRDAIAPYRDDVAAVVLEAASGR